MLEKRVLLRNQHNEVIADFVFPAEWQAAPDILDAKGKLYRFCGRQDGVLSYWPATLEPVPADVVIREAEPP